MRPNPLIATFTAIVKKLSLLSPGNRVAHANGVCPGVNAILEKILYLPELMVFIPNQWGGLRLLL
jgi:hypothetical protein